ncbi:hypothetical protein VTH06DRAFT_4585 [Thermothelomyces fergusii]
MPVIHHPFGDIAREKEIPKGCHHILVHEDIYFAVTFLALLTIVRCLVRRSGISHSPIKSFCSTFTAKNRPSNTLAAPSEEKTEQPTQSVTVPGYRGQQSLSDRLRGFVCGSPRMDPSKSGLKEDDHAWSALAPSRGVSANAPQQAHDLSTTDVSSVPSKVWTSPNRLRQTTSSPEASTERPSDHSDGIPGKAPEGEAVIPTDGNNRLIFGDLEEATGDGGDRRTGRHFEDENFRPAPADPSRHSGTRFTVPRRFSRPPPPLPLTPPTFHGSFFLFEEREPNYASSVPSTVGSSSVRRSESESKAAPGSADVFGSSPQSSATFPQRRSYTKSVPIGVPASSATSSESLSASAATSSSTSPSFSPSSYPPKLPLLPPPPPSAPPDYVFVGGPGGPGVVLPQQEIRLQGEILSVVDSAGHGWKRHTRVYGGGVCLACIAAAARDGGRGGFYGDKVPLEDRRY